ncbi:MAG: zf-TFIIB domain-containing protein [Polyangiaceae bacterium]
MQCRACSAPIGVAGVFPGGRVTCRACGADNVTPSAQAPGAPDPYRSPPRSDGLGGDVPADAAPSHAVPGGARDLGPLCPRCTRLLHDGGDGELECTGCDGVFVGHAAMSAAVAAERPVEPPARPPPPPRLGVREAEVRYVHCPSCGQMMSRMNFGRRSGVILDVCREHGTWFDAGERAAVLEFVHAGGIEADLTAPAGPTPETEAVAREAMKMLALENAQWQQHMRREIQLANDLVLVLFGGSRYRVWR